MDHSLKKKNEYKNFKKQEIQGIFFKTNEIKLVLNMTRLVETLRIYLEEQLLTKYNVIKRNITGNSKYDGYQRAIALISGKLFNKKTSNAHKETGFNFENKALSKELHKPIIAKT